MILIIEMVICCVLFTIAFISGKKKDPLSGLHNMPKELQKKVASYPQYQSVEVVSTQQRIKKKLPALLVVAVLFIGMIYMSGARSFRQGFLSSFVLWIVIKLYVVFVLECGWLAHTPSVWIPGTEDMKHCYQDYAFYMRSIPGSLFAGAIVACVVGLFLSFFL